MEDVRVREKKDSFKEIDKLAPDPNNFWSIDLLKVLMMVLVILDHSLPHDIIGQWYARFWQRIAIPVFMVIIGFNWGKSLSRRKDQSLRSLYSWNWYFKPKIRRYVVPFAIIYGLSIIFRVYVEVFPSLELFGTIPDMRNWWLKVALILPVWGPGNWFVPMLFLLILIFPFFYWLFYAKKWMYWIGLLICYVIEAAYQFTLTMFVVKNGFDWRANFFTFVPFQLMSAIGLGLFLSVDHRWDAPKNIIIWLLGLASLAYIITTYTENGPPLFTRWVVFDYNLWVYPWSALIVMLFMNIFPKSPVGKQFRFISTISRATYHILMTQIFYFSIIYGLFLIFGWSFGIPLGTWTSRHYNYLWFYPLNVILTFTIGTLWYLAGKRFWDSRQSTKKRISQKQLAIMKSKGWIKTE